MAMGYVAGKEAAERAGSVALPEVDAAQVDMLTGKIVSYLERKEGVRPVEIKDRVRGILGEHVIFDRNEEDLNLGIKGIEDIRDKMLPRLCTAARTKTFNLEWMEALEAENMVDVAEMTLRSALVRKESRGLHERIDYPEASSEWLKHIIIKKVDGQMSFSTEAVTFPYVQPK